MSVFRRGGVLSVRRSEIEDEDEFEERLRFQERGREKMTIRILRRLTMRDIGRMANIEPNVEP